MTHTANGLSFVWPYHAAALFLFQNSVFRLALDFIYLFIHLASTKQVLYSFTHWQNSFTDDVTLCVTQSKKRQYDQEVENLERQQKQTIERLEQEHTSRLRDEAKRIKAEQDKELSKYQNMLKNRKKEVSIKASSCPFSPSGVWGSIYNRFLLSDQFLRNHCLAAQRLPHLIYFVT